MNTYDKNSKGIQFHKIDFKNIKKYNNNKSTNEIFMVNPNKSSNNKDIKNDNSINDISLKHYSKNISLRKNKSLFKIPRVPSINKVAKNKKNNDNSVKKRNVKKKEGEKNWFSQKDLVKVCSKQKYDLKKCKTFCHNNKINKDLNNKDEQDTNKNKNLGNKRKNITNKKSKKKGNNNEIKGERKSSNFIYYIKKKILCCF